MTFKNFKLKIKNSEKDFRLGFIDFGLLAIGALIVAAVVIPLISSRIVSRKVTTQERAAGGDGATLEATIPSQMTAGQTYNLTFKAVNAGTTTWTETEKYRLGWSYDNQTGSCSDFSPTSQCAWKIASTWKCDGTQTAQPCDKREYLGSGESIVPGRMKTWTVTVKAPSTLGTYPLRFRMLKEFVGYFGNEVIASVSVGSATPTVTNTPRPTATPTGTPKTCSITSATVNKSTVIIGFSGNANRSLSEPVRAWIEKWPGASRLISVPVGTTEVGYIGEYYYRLNTTCNSSNYQSCNAQQTVALPGGTYYTHCELPTGPSLCSGNPMCSYEGGPDDCFTAGGWRSCSNSDNMAFTINSLPVATATPTPGFCPRGAEGNLNCGGDGIINLYDLTLMIDGHVWNKPPPTLPYPTLPALKYTPDISPAGGNGIVDVSDLSRLLNNWSR